MTKDGQSYKILVIEDNPGDFLLVSDYLEDEILNPVLLHADSFAVARQKLETEQSTLDIVLLDLTLPDMRGEELLNEIMNLTGSVPVIVLTGYTDLEFAKTSLALGASDYLLKDQLNPGLLYKSIIYNIERNKYLVRIRESEQRYVDLFHLSPLPMWVYDLATFRFLDVNAAAVSHYGYTETEFLAMTIKDIRPQEEVRKLETEVAISRDKEVYTFQGVFIHRKKNGEEIIVDVRSNIMYYQGRKAEIVLANDITEKHRIQEELHINTYLVEARERRRISEALHDGLQQTLLASFMRFENIKPKVEHLLEQKYQERYNEGISILEEGIQQARSMAHSLVPIQIENNGLVMAIEGLIKRNSGVAIEFLFKENLKGFRLPISLEILLFRITQEGINNIIKHSEAGHSVIDLVQSESFVTLRIFDDGRGFEMDLDKVNNFGLRAIRSRVKALGGEFGISSNSGNGTRLEVSLPLASGFVK